ncbi:MAG TPA: hypothetical protein VFR76_03540, partial [Verrucomicrobiae bacterium]|nr:hypothetical protein [Verrucomicrobiae bacterium]
AFQLSWSFQSFNRLSKDCRVGISSLAPSAVTFFGLISLRIIRKEKGISFNYFLGTWLKGVFENSSGRLSVAAGVLACRRTGASRPANKTLETPLALEISASWKTRTAVPGVKARGPPLPVFKQAQRFLKDYRFFIRIDIVPFDRTFFRDAWPRCEENIRIGMISRPNLDPAALKLQRIGLALANGRKRGCCPAVPGSSLLLEDVSQARAQESKKSFSRNRRHIHPRAQSRHLLRGVWV